MPRRSLLLLSLLSAFVAPGAAPAQLITPAIADPACAFLVEGVVLRADGRPAAGVVVERTTDTAGRLAYTDLGYRVTTDAQGRFRFHFDGLGLCGPRQWTLAVRRAGCRGTVRTMTLREGDVPPRGGHGELARGLVLRLPACARD